MPELFARGAKSIDAYWAWRENRFFKSTNPLIPAPISKRVLAVSGTQTGLEGALGWEDSWADIATGKIAASKNARCIRVFIFWFGCAENGLFSEIDCLKVGTAGEENAGYHHALLWGDQGKPSICDGRIAGRNERAR